MRRIAPATPLDEILEKDWQRTIVDLAKRLGWRRPYHTKDSRKSEPGFPDLCIVRDRLVFIECKREKTKMTDAQKDWARALLAAGVEIYVVRPRDLQRIASVLAARSVGSTGDLHTAAAMQARADLLDALYSELDEQLALGAA